MREIDQIILHCSATRREWMEDASLAQQVHEIRRWHVDGNGWSDIGYHFVIGRDGEIADGRPLARAGAHTRGHNSTSVGVCLIGGFGSDANDAPDDHFTVEQLKAARDVCRSLLVDFPNATVHGHNEFAAKACPGFDVAKWWAA